MVESALSWETAPEMLDAKTLGFLLSAKPVWVRRHLRHLMTPLGPRALRWPKRDVLAYLEAQKVRAADVFGSV